MQQPSLQSCQVSFPSHCLCQSDGIHLTQAPDTLGKILGDSVHLAARICETPAALLWFSDHDRLQPYISWGEDYAFAAETSAFLERTLQQPEPLVISDILADSETGQFPTAALRFYAGLSFQVTQDNRWGILCAISPHPQTLTANQLESFQVLGRQLAHQLELHSTLSQREQAEKGWQHQQERERLVATIAQRIHHSLNLEEVLTTAVAEIREVLQADRVLVYRLNSDWTGCVAVESVGEGWRSTLGTTLRDHHFNQNFVQACSWGRTYVVNDVATSGLSQCYADLMTQFQIRATLMVPILRGDQIWGWLMVHQCSSARTWQPFEIGLLQHLATQLAIAIQQSELYHQVQSLNADLEHQVQERTRQLQQSLEFAAVFKRITDKIRDSLDEAQILQIAVQELAGVLRVEYCCAALYNRDRTSATITHECNLLNQESALGQVLPVVDTPKVHARLLAGHHFEAYQQTRSQYFFSGELGDLACPDLFHQIAAKLLCPILIDHPLEHPPAYPATQAKRNFEGEQGTIGYLAVINQTEHTFTAAEVRLVQQVANQCAIAIRQARLYQAAQMQVAELEKLNKLKDDFLSTVSHELRTPMSNMKMAIQMLEIVHRQSQFPEVGHDKRASLYLKILQKECDREISLINDLLDLQSLEGSIRPLSPKVLQLHSWLKEITQPFQHRTLNRRQTLQLHIPTDLVEVTLDPLCLERILAELMNNACKYSPPGADIDLTVQVQQSLLQLSVSNSGTEIPPQEIPRIFDKFYRIPSADPWQQGGTGLGLALVQKLTHYMGGTIDVRSHSNQVCFTLSLPLNAAGLSWA